MRFIKNVMAGSYSGGTVDTGRLDTFLLNKCRVVAGLLFGEKPLVKVKTEVVSDEEDND